VLFRSINYNAPCSTVVSALEALPNSVIPMGSTRCLQWPNYHSITATDEPALITPNPFYGVKYTLAFPKNPGILKQMKINTFLDGSRPTIFPATGSSSEVKTVVYPNGFYGEYLDFFDKCLGVDVTLEVGLGLYNFLDDLTLLEFRLLSQCLGDGDGFDRSYSAKAKVEGQEYQWDFGSIYNPHLIKLVDLSGQFDDPEDEGGPLSDLCEPSNGFSATRPDPMGTDPVRCRHEKHPGFFVVVIYDHDVDQFKLINRPAEDYSSSTRFAVFTTRGTAQMVSESAMIYTTPTQATGKSQIYSNKVYSTNSTGQYRSFKGNVDCETTQPNVDGALDCIEKGDRIFFLDPSFTLKSHAANPKYINLYEVKKIFVGPKRFTDDPDRRQIVLDMSINSHWPLSSGNLVRAYIFKPPDVKNREGGYSYVEECSNRGLCDEFSGICDCFKGFQSDDCGIQYNILY